SQAPENTVDPGLFSLGAPPPVTAAAQPVPVTDVDKAIDSARRLLAQGDAAGAARLLAGLLEGHGNNPQLRKVDGQALIGLGNRDDALREFQTAARIKSDDPEFKLAVAGTLALMGRTDDALAEYQDLSTRYPRDTQVLTEMGSLLNKAGRFDAAV